MFNVTNHSEGFIVPRGLYCVWVSMRGDGRAPLISIWINCGMAALSHKTGRSIALSGVQRRDLALRELWSFRAELFVVQDPMRIHQTRSMQRKQTTHQPCSAR